MENKLTQLNERIREISPNHDYELGLVHPYWSRKPINLVELILQCLSDKGDVVYDPFCGSGTTVFASMLSDRNAIGNDLNPLSSFLIDSVLHLGDCDIIDWLEEFIGKIEKETNKWWHLQGEEFIERERFDVVGDLKGAHNLTLVELIAKTKKKSKWSNRKAITLNQDYKSPRGIKKYLNKHIQLNNLELLENSRIAIHKGMTVGDLFLDKTNAFINLYLEKINEESCKEKKNIARFLLSSCLPLLRLSDKKASSQWPFWRPKKNLTSRNPNIVLSKRLKEFRGANGFILEKFDFDKCDYEVLNKPAQDIKLQDISKFKKVDLVLTDPPYIDHVPYLEYSSLWTKMIGLKNEKDLFQHEIVKTNAAGRESDSKDYLKRLLESLGTSADLLKDEGYFAFFYQDYNIHHWKMIKEVLTEKGLSFVDAIAIPKQRRSHKTVTSPGRTLDGDLLLVFKKSEVKACTAGIYEDSCESKSYFENYTSIIRSGLYSDWKKVPENIESIKKML